MLWGASTVPVDPDAPEAKRWVIDELAKSQYVAAQPTWFDRLSKGIADWFGSLRFGGVDGPPGLGAVVVIVLLVIVLVVAFFIFGAPRLRNRSTVSGSLFGEDDARDAAAMRRAAETAAARGDFALAIAELFRSIARGLAERTVLTTTPGTTARDFAVRAGTAFPALASELADAATTFDAVRYLGDAGSSAGFERVAELERKLRAAQPILEPIGA